MSLSAADLALIKSTATSKFETDLQAEPETTYQLFTLQDTFGAEGYVPTLMGGIGPAQEWVDERVLHDVAEFGVRFVGKVYENSVKKKKEALRVSPVQTAAKLGAAMAKDAKGFSHKKIVQMLKGNPMGFDKVPLFGDHKYSDAEGATVYNNDIEGTNKAWFLMNEESFIEATAEDYQIQFYGGDNTEIDFMKDSLAIGWRTVKIFAPGFWADTIRSKAALTSENLRAAMNRQIGFKNDQGEPLTSRPKYLVVGIDNAAAAEKLIKAALVGGGDTNVDYGRLQLVILDTLDI